MVKVAVCVEPVFTELPFLERVRRVGELGFPAIEFWFADYCFDGVELVPEEKDIPALKKICQEAGLAVSDFVLSSPEGEIGGAMVNPADRTRYLESLRKLVPIARELNCKKLITCVGNVVEGLSREEQHRSAVETLKAAAPIAQEAGLTLLLEPLNTHVDHPGYFLDSAREGAEIVREVAHPNVRLLYDIYHMQIMEGNILAFIEKNIDIIGHFHAAGVPGRHELNIGELNYPNIVRRIDELGYEGYFGLEYWPTKDSAQSLREMKALLGG
ncbi:MAG: hydroxypyruvate isomerase family protein [Anaerolineae bacterium]